MIPGRSHRSHARTAPTARTAPASAEVSCETGGYNGFFVANISTRGAMTQNTQRARCNASHGCGIIWHNGRVLDPCGPSLRSMILSLEIRVIGPPHGSVIAEFAPFRTRSNHKSGRKDSP